MERIKLFIVCILNAFIALVNPKYVSQIYKDHNKVKRQREKRKEK